jgi:hypothetical protein
MVKARLHSVKDDLLSRLAHMNLSTPLGELVAADLGSSLAKFRRAGVFSITVKFNARIAAPMIERIDERMNLIFDATHNLRMGCPYEPQDDGSYLFHFSCAARTTDGKGKVTQHHPRMWDAKGNQWPTAHVIPIGSLVSVRAGFAHDYKGDAGVTLELIAVQTIERCASPVKKRRRRKRTTASRPPDKFTTHPQTPLKDCAGFFASLPQP